MSELKITAEKLESFKDFEYSWNHNGMGRDGKSKWGKLEDALSVPDAPLFVPKTLTNAIADAIEPMLIGVGLLQRIQFQPGTFITFPSMGAIDGDFDMAEEEEYPEIKVQMGPGTAISSVGKQGAAVKFAEDILRYSTFPVINMHVTAVGRAMARFKERKVWRLLTNEGTVTHDNVTPANSIYGVTRGRGLAGTANGSAIMDDLFEAYAAVLYNGFLPNLLVMHPLTWLMWVQDPVLRAFTNDNNGSTYFATWRGNVNHPDEWPTQFGGMGISTGRYIVPPTATSGATPSALTEFSQRMNSAPVLPGYGNLGAFTIVVTPFMPFDTATNTTDILMADSSMLGFYIEDMPLSVEEIRDPYHDILKIKMKERYTMAIKEDGLGVAVLKNVVVTPNEILLPARATIPVNGTINPINRTTPVP